MFGIFWKLKEQATIFFHEWSTTAFPEGIRTRYLYQTLLIPSLLSKIPNSGAIFETIAMQLCGTRWPGVNESKKGYCSIYILAGTALKQLLDFVCNLAWCLHVVLITMNAAVLLVLMYMWWHINNITFATMFVFSLLQYGYPSALIIIIKAVK